MTGSLDSLRTALASRYAIERELGRGGMAAVYLAEDLKHHRHVAIKVLDPELARALGAERFLREVEVTANFTHPHILALHDSGEADGFLYYVMPYVEGETLRDRMDREGQLPLDDALQITREVASALSYAHSHDVIHRDIKPENVLLSAGEAVVADFGIARAISEAGRERLTDTGISIGTPAYMSPEQASGEQKLDGRSDVYSLACVLYEMLAGEPPYTGATAQAVLAKKLGEATPRVSVVRERVPPNVEAAIDQALAKTPADRFVTAQQFVEALNAERVNTGERPTAVKRLLIRAAVAVSVLAVVAVAAAILLDRSVGDVGYPRTEIAVLPFENLSAEGSHSYVAAALHGELVNQLQAVGGLRPRGRTSVLGYAGRVVPVAQVAQELEVGSIVEATVQVVGNRLHMNVALIDAANGGQLWTDQYDESLDDLLAVQNDIATQIVGAVGTVLSETETHALSAVPTDDPAAYQLYLQGKEYYGRPGMLPGNLEVAQAFFERALTLDSAFALAHAALSQVHGIIFWLRYDPRPERLEWQREEARTALRLAPDLPQAHVAMGYVHYVGSLDWQNALEEYRIALEGLPNDAGVWARIGYTHRRLGNWEEAVAAADKAIALDPRNTSVIYDLGASTSLILHSYRDAVDRYGRALAVAPDLSAVDVYRGWTWVVSHGRLDSLAAALDRHPPAVDLGAWGDIRDMRAMTLYWGRKPDSLLALLRRTPRPVFDSQVGYTPLVLWAAWAHQLRGDEVAARAAFDSARVELDSVVASLPDDWRVHAARGMALAGLEWNAEARSEAVWLQQSRDYREDLYNRPNLAADRARILVGIGDVDAALAEIEPLLVGPSWSSTHVFQLDPRFDPVRHDPRFQALLRKYEN